MSRKAYPGRDIYIVDGSRSPFLKATGKPGPFSAAGLGVATAQPLLMRQPFSPDRFDEVILGCVMPGPDEANIARVCALRLACGDETPAWTVQRNCASGLQALDCAAQAISEGRSDLILAGGVEVMSHAPLLWKDDMVAWLARWNRARSMMQKIKALGALRMKNLAPVIGLLRGLRDPVVGMSMGQTAEQLAWRFGISRQHMDEYAVLSHQRLAAAGEAGHLDEIEAVFDDKGKGWDHDTGLRADSNLQALSKLRPVFDKPFGNVTAGNSAQITDGCTWLVLASETAVENYQLPVVGKIVATQWAGVSPREMGLGPAHAIAPLLQQTGHRLEDIDYWEINEAFAVQVLACREALNSEEYCREHFHADQALGEIPLDRLNVDGGGISIGHPVGSSGARIVLHLLRTLQRTGAKTGIASLCIGGGQGGAMLIENLDNQAASGEPS